MADPVRTGVEGGTVQEQIWRLLTDHREVKRTRADFAAHSINGGFAIPQCACGEAWSPLHQSRIVAAAAESALAAERERRETAEAELAKLNEEKKARAKRGEWRWDDYDAVLEAATKAEAERDRLRATHKSAAEVVEYVVDLGAMRDSLRSLLAAGVSVAATESED